MGAAFAVFGVVVLTAAALAAAGAARRGEAPSGQTPAGAGSGSGSPSLPGAGNGSTGSGATVDPDQTIPGPIGITPLPGIRIDPPTGEAIPAVPLPGPISTGPIGGGQVLPEANTSTPTPGRYYQVRSGDSASSVARAIVGPGSTARQRLEVMARLSEAPQNSHFLSPHQQSGYRLSQLVLRAFLPRWQPRDGISGWRNDLAGSGLGALYVPPDILGGL